MQPDSSKLFDQKDCFLKNIKKMIELKSTPPKAAESPERDHLVLLEKPNLATKPILEFLLTPQ